MPRHGAEATEKQKGSRASDPLDLTNELVTEAMYRRVPSYWAGAFLASPRDYGAAQFGKPAPQQ